MPTVLAERWIADGSGSLVRRGRSPRDGREYLFNNTLAGIADGAFTYSELQEAFADGTIPDNSTMRSRLSKETTEKGPAFVWTSEAGSMSQVSWYPRLPTNNAIDVMVSYWLRVGDGTNRFDCGLGLKLPMGLGGHVNDVTPPTGSTTPDPLGWSRRYMLLDDDGGGQVTNGVEFVIYDYEHDEVRLNKRGNQSGLISWGPRTTVDWDWHLIECRTRLNTVTSNGVSANSDGIDQLWVDGVLRYQNLASQLRIYDSAGHDRVMFDWFFGGDASWGPAIGGRKIFVADPKVWVLAA